MMASEIIVIIGFAIMVGLAVTMFFDDVDFSFMIDWLSPKESEFSEVGAKELAGKLVATWKSCREGEVYKSDTYYYNQSGAITLASIGTELKAINMCDSLQIGTQACGTRDDVIIAPGVSGPGIVRLRCEPGLKQIHVE
ncbi:hypothetical protein H6504_02010 [Candidatus Woesearchaeota archaeon]|nr:hypothetical protein [Candidatus Woesearchaeota archaeon]